ncbi:MAG: 16S rRNA (cytosine(1402)-N(4))-methyltransferase RsmH [Bacteroidetes bacterium]|nr:16S rRNA (cytosine(1402)-N(4))-methyltransferase RsmH [Bacteroidota bacterium]
MAVYHEPVLLKESIDFLVTDVSGTYVDATFGGGGHTRGLLSILNADARIIGFDVDENSSRIAEGFSSSDRRFSFVHRNFSGISESLAEMETGPVSGVLFDLGVSSFQIDHEEGFSYRRDEKLDMRLDKRLEISAYEVVNSYTADQLADVFWKYGEESRSRALARAIVKEREHGRIETTFRLGEIIGRILGKSPKILSRIFQALRIEVNKELDSLTAGLDAAIEVTARGGRVAVISYHSLEDRIVKEKFRYEAATCVCPPRTIVCTCGKIARLKQITRKPILPSLEEIQINKRARSAKLRVSEKIV